MAISVIGNIANNAYKGGNDMAKYWLECLSQILGYDLNRESLTYEYATCKACMQRKPCVSSMQTTDLFVKFKMMVVQQIDRITSDDQTMDIQSAYIRVLGAAATALDELEPLRNQIKRPQLENACAILEKAIEDTEEHTELR